MILDPILSRMGYIKATNYAPPAFLADSAPSFQIPGGHLPQTQSELYQRLSNVNTAVTVTANLAAPTPLMVKKRVGEGANDIKNHPFEELIRLPNPLQSRFEFLTSVFSYFMLTGNAYIWLNRTSDTQAPLEMWIIPSHMIRPVPDGRMYLRGYVFDPGIGKTVVPLETFEICHLKKFHPLNPFVGLSPIESIATIAVGDMEMAKWNTNLFGKDNARLPGFLAFADPIQDGDWARIKDEFKRQTSGTKRSLVMLRNTGAGGVEWVQAGLSQKEMEFLMGRTANKEEIFSVFAPGLASMLAVNATEANSRTGKATLMEAAIWPMLVSMAEKVTSGILPAYGEGLVAEFEDVRLSDRAMEIQEQTAYEAVHTIDEIREKYYNDKPIGDDRGKLLPAEVGKAALGGKDIESENATPPALLPFTGQQPPSSNGAKPPKDEDEVTEDEGDSEAETAGQMKAELKKWQTFAIHRVKAGKPMREFVTSAIPVTLKAAIEGALDGITAAGDVPRVFADALAWQNYP